jgi:peptidyl-tRNA hydrolase, PTH1 family
MADPLLVVGLGNPGPNYAQTRHNLGFMVADRLAARLGSTFKAHKRSGAEIVTGRLGGRSVVLAKPRCYMNETGRQVGPLAKFYSVPAADVVVIHDDLDIDFGQIRLKIGGGEGGHNGLRSVVAALGTKDFQPSCSSSWAWSRPKTGSTPGKSARAAATWAGCLPTI